MTTALLVVDTETGGLDPATSCIIEIAAQVLLLDKKSIEFGSSFEAKIVPDRPVAPQAAAVNGYTPQKWRGFDGGAQVLVDFRHWVDDQCKAYDKPMWTGCNPIFDLKFYKSDAKRHNVLTPDGLSYRVIDVQSMAIPLLFEGAVSSVALKSLRTWAGCEGEQTHTAMGDTLDTCEVIGKLLLRGIG